MAWTPRRTTSANGSDATAPASPTPSRRRKAAPSETPNVDKAVKRSPRHSPGARPRGGVSYEREPHKGEDERVRKSFRLGKRWSEIVWAVKKGEYTWAEFVEGLDEEELARGQLKAEDGSFKGRPPSLVPREFHLACQREMRRRFEELFSGEVIKVTKMYLKMAQDSEVKPETRAKMLQYAMERVFGGIPKDIRVSQEAPWEQMVVNVLGSEGDTDMPDHLTERYARYSERQGGGATDGPGE